AGDARCKRPTKRQRRSKTRSISSPPSARTWRVEPSPISPVRLHEGDGTMNAQAAESRPTGIVAFYRSIWKALERVPVALPVLVMRAGVALVFWRSGRAKLPFGNDTVITLFREE